ncbi:alpha/beta fold hydrolase [Rummeliibacillus stabekisii]|uniref:alpha/beta fold hydrolase n=1 Tax=Rummeliibacillus stabekisii TaxID=241244 RepID=UPI001167A828|nr:alpha/beta hydrolase [Rummeliibacillus stabekisii]MBB5170603.1 pimeloyl-ACP methyl ester carboxylesterase [Rummeliibacillus stabekisii]GEL04859.1 lipase [Rummeliibacillus stabekisii]
MALGYYEWGNQDNPALVFLHGMGSSGLSFGELAKLLQNDFYVIAFDLPGHGGEVSLDNEKEYFPARMAERLSNFIDSLWLTDVYLVGHSWGAHLALYMAGLYSEKIKGLVLLDGGYFQQGPAGVSLNQQLTDVGAFIDSVCFASWNEFLDSERANSSRWSKEIEEGCLAQAAEVDGEIRLSISPFTAKAVMKGMHLEPTAAIFPKVQSPVLLLHSTMPKEIEEERHEAIEYLLNVIPHAEVQAIPNTSHEIYRDAPEIIVSKLKEWFYGQTKSCANT